MGGYSRNRGKYTFEFAAACLLTTSHSLFLKVNVKRFSKVRIVTFTSITACILLFPQYRNSHYFCSQKFCVKFSCNNIFVRFHHAAYSTMKLLLVSIHVKNFCTSCTRQKYSNNEKFANYMYSNCATHCLPCV